MANTSKPAPAASIAAAEKDTSQQNTTEQNAHVGWMSDFWGSFKNNFKSEANGVLQIANAAGLNVGEFQLSKVDKAAPGSAEWFFETGGQIAATAVSFAGLRWGVARTIGRAFGVTGAAAEVTSQSALNQGFLSAGVGGFMGTVLTPSADPNHLLWDRTKTGVSQALTMGIMGGGAGLLRSAADYVPNATAAAIVRNGFFNNAVSGYFGGGIGDLASQTMNGQAWNLSQANRSGLETMVVGVGTHGLDAGANWAAPRVSAATRQLLASFKSGASAAESGLKATPPSAFAVPTPNLELTDSGDAKVAATNIVHEKIDITPVWLNDEVPKAEQYQADSAKNGPWDHSVGKLDPLPSLKGDIDADVVVVGSGVIGQQIAMRLAAAGKRVVVLESNTVGSGTSKMMGAMLTPIPDSGLMSTEERLGANFGQMMRRLIDARSSVEQLGRRYGDYQKVPSYNVAYTEDNADVPAEVNIMSRFDPGARVVNGDEAHRIFPQARLAGIYPSDGNVNPYKMLVGMSRSGQYQVFEHSPALAMLRTTDGARVVTPEGSVTAGKVILATSTPMAPFGDIAQHLTPVQTFANVANIGRRMPGNYFDSPEQTSGKVPFSYWRQFNLPQFDPDATLVGSVAHFLNADQAVPFEPRLPTVTSQLFNGAQGRNPITALIWTIYDSDRYTPGLPVYLTHPNWKAISGAFGGGGTGLVNGALLGEAAEMDAAGQRDPFLSP